MKNYFYCLVMFPYPSGNGLHIGHAYNYALIDSYCRWQKGMGRYKNIFQPFGYDSFGLPAENYAREHGRDPKEVTYENIDKFRSQMKKMNTKFEELLITSDESYQKWTQWLFLKMKEHGMAYKANYPTNYCPSCETILANEQVIKDNPASKEGKCERCKTKIEFKEVESWYFKISKYRDRLISNLDWIDYPEKTKKQQRQWLENMQDWCVSRQRSWGCPIPIEGETDTLDTFVDSSFYFLRYLDPNNDKELFTKDKYKQVDLYIGGNEHACMHLIYARAINMFLYDIGIVKEEEPFKKVIHQGMITSKGRKMSKSLGNVVDPDNYDSDELRMYLMFIGHYLEGGDWDDSKIVGIRRAIYKWKRWIDSAEEVGDKLDILTLTNTIDGYVESFKFNKVISTLMEFYNKNKDKKINIKDAELLSKIIESFAPNFKIKNYEKV